MQFYKAIITLTLTLIQLAASSSVSFEVLENKRECVYVMTPERDCTVSYFFSVQFGSNDDFDINYEVTSPENPNKPFIIRKDEQQGEWEFLAEQKGEYSFCFYSSLPNDKIVELDVKYQCDSTNDLRKQKLEAKKQKRMQEVNSDNEDDLQRSLDSKVEQIDRKLFTLEKNIAYYKSRNNRNQSTVISTSSRITYFSFYGILLVCAMGFAQIGLLKFLFKRSRRGAV